MGKSTTALSAFVAALVLIPAAGWAQNDGGEQGDDGERAIEFHAVLKNLYLYRNDSDFDRSAPVYNPDGQSMGVAGTDLRSFITWHVSNKLRIHYEVEIGLNVWSRNSPDEGDPTADDIFLLKHREIYTEGTLADDLVGFKVGYQRLNDPTVLFIGHWFGAADFSLNFQKGAVHAVAGAFPDTTYEGLTAQFNNFTHDTALFALYGNASLGRHLTLNAGLFTIQDESVIGRSMTLWTPALNLTAVMNPDPVSLSLSADLAMQFGPSRGRSYDGGDQMNHGWAGQIHGALTWKRFALDANVLALSADDPYDNDGSNGAFYYSGRTRSSTLFLTEDKVHDWYDNIDERLASPRGAFYLSRAGLLLADLKLSYLVTRWFRPTLIFGTARVLESKNALGEDYVGTEADVDLQFPVDPALTFHLIGGLLAPGGAAGALVNSIDTNRAENIWTAEAAMIVEF
ncbi:MAG: hypothetical protein HY897_16160 [Deltaproteobacteria bacterium]|nr:hypothetical protein [Deltaproteobacteria bacterium]